MKAAPLCFLFALSTPAAAFDHGFPADTERSKFFQALKRPDFYPESCCGKADAYEADTYTRNADGSYTVTVTDGSAKVFPDGTKRAELKTGTIVTVPAKKVNPPIETSLNPTGHAWLFVSVYSGEAGAVFCFAPLPEGS